MPGISRREFGRRAAAGLAATALARRAAGGAEQAGRPNVIFILADDLGYGDLGCYGQQRILTPHLDRMAAEGIRFTQHYAGSPVCAPSRCVLMTGLHTGHAYVRDNLDAATGQLPLPPDTLTVARLFKQAGYATAVIGKWGLGGVGSSGVPAKQGFDYSFGYLCQHHAHNYYPEFLYRGEEKVPLAGNKLAPQPPGRREGAGVAAERAQYSADVIWKEAMSFLERAKGKPFFLYLTPTIPHANNEAGEKGMEVPSLEPYAGKDWPAPEKGRAAMITRLDRDIGELFAKLKELELDGSTLVLFSSDNGPHAEGGSRPEFFSSSGPFRGFKRDLYEGGIRVPLIARWPGAIKPGSTSDHVSAFWDFLPTCADLLRLSAQKGLDGISYSAALRGDRERQKEHRFLYWEFPARATQAVRWENWKALRFVKDGKLELYDLAADPGERNDLSAEKPDVLSRLKLLMATSRMPSPHFSLPTADAPPGGAK